MPAKLRESNNSTVIYRNFNNKKGYRFNNYKKRYEYSIYGLKKYNDLKYKTN